MFQCGKVILFVWCVGLVTSARGATPLTKDVPTSGIRLPPAFAGHDVTSVRRLVSKAPRKGEFETTEQHEARLAGVLAKALGVDPGERVLAFVFEPASIQYDADLEVLGLTLMARELGADTEGAFEGMGLVVQHSQEGGGSYVGQNAFGARRRIRRLKVRETVLGTKEDLPGLNLDGRVEIGISMKPERAKALKGGLKVLALAVLKYPFFEAQRIRTAPTLDAPVELDASVDVIVADVLDVLVVHPASGEIVYAVNQERLFWEEGLTVERAIGELLNARVITPSPPADGKWGVVELRCKGCGGAPVAIDTRHRLVAPWTGKMAVGDHVALFDGERREFTVLPEAVVWVEFDRSMDAGSSSSMAPPAPGSPLPVQTPVVADVKSPSAVTLSGLLRNPTLPNPNRDVVLNRLGQAFADSVVIVDKECLPGAFKVATIWYPSCGMADGSQVGIDLEYPPHEGATLGLKEGPAAQTYAFGDGSGTTLVIRSTIWRKGTQPPKRVEYHPRTTGAAPSSVSDGGRWR